MFLQEKLGKLRSTAGGSPAQPLPPRLTAASIEVFLDCSWFAQEGCKWVMDKVRGERDAENGLWMGQGERGMLVSRNPYSVHAVGDLDLYTPS